MIGEARGWPGRTTWAAAFCWMLAGTPAISDRILELLVEEMGFDLFGIEASLPGCEPIRR